MRKPVLDWRGVFSSCPMNIIFRNLWGRRYYRVDKSLEALHASIVFLTKPSGYRFEIFFTLMNLQIVVRWK